MCLKLEVNHKACDNCNDKSGCRDKCTKCVFWGMCPRDEEKNCDGPFASVGIASIDEGERNEL